MLSIRDVVAECGGLGLLGLLVWTLPSAIEWVGDSDLTDLQTVGRFDDVDEALKTVNSTLPSPSTAPLLTASPPPPPQIRTTPRSGAAPPGAVAHARWGCARAGPGLWFRLRVPPPFRCPARERLAGTAVRAGTATAGRVSQAQAAASTARCPPRAGPSGPRSRGGYGGAACPAARAAPCPPRPAPRPRRSLACGRWWHDPGGVQCMVECMYPGGVAPSPAPSPAPSLRRDLRACAALLSAGWLASLRDTDVREAVRVVREAVRFDLPTLAGGGGDEIRSPLCLPLFLLSLFLSLPPISHLLSALSHALTRSQVCYRICYQHHYRTIIIVFAISILRSQDADSHHRAIVTWCLDSHPR